MVMALVKAVLASANKRCRFGRWQAATLATGRTDWSREGGAMDVPLPAKVGVDFLGLPPSARELGPPPGRTIDVIAVRGCFGVMHYQLDGPRDGELCVWVHGLGDFCKHSDLLAAALIAGGYRVLRFDFFGRGWSDSPAGAAYDMEMYIGQMRALFETLTLGGKPKTLIGWSMGGLIAQGYTEKFPSDVVRLVLLAPAGVMTSSKLPPCLSGLQCLFNACACLVPTLRSVAFPASEGWSMAGAAPTAAERKSLMAGDFHDRNIDSTNCQAMAAWQQAQAAAVAGHSEAVMQSVIKMPWTTAAPLVRAVGNDSQKRRRPTLLLRGSDDPVVTIDDRALEQYSLAYGEQLQAPPPPAATGHCFYLEEPTATHQLILAFLARPLPSRSSASSSGGASGGGGGGGGVGKKTSAAAQSAASDGGRTAATEGGGGGGGMSDERLDGLLQAVSDGLVDESTEVGGGGGILAPSPRAGAGGGEAAAAAAAEGSSSVVL
jgi:pimeloyl-ACP methyl ester carboxylesterase